MTLRGKQREIIAREQRFLDVAQAILLEEGSQAVSIARIAEATGFSRGTVYQTFRSKEELLVELCLNCRSRMFETARRASRCPGRPRERMVALAEGIMWHCKQWPEDRHTMRIVNNPSVLETANGGQRQAIREHERGILSLLQEIVTEAAVRGDLSFRADRTPQGVCFGVWSMAERAFAACAATGLLREIGILEPLEELVRNAHCLLDGYGWRPLSGEWDYAETARRVREALECDVSNQACTAKDAV